MKSWGKCYRSHIVLNSSATESRIGEVAPRARGPARAAAAKKPTIVESSASEGESEVPSEPEDDSDFEED